MLSMEPTRQQQQHTSTACHDSNPRYHHIHHIYSTSTTSTPHPPHPYPPHVTIATRDTITSTTSITSTSTTSISTTSTSTTCHDRNPRYHQQNERNYWTSGGRKKSVLPRTNQLKPHLISLALSKALYATISIVQL